jgi:hypothetical protein
MKTGIIPNAGLFDKQLTEEKLIKSLSNSPAKFLRFGAACATIFGCYVRFQYSPYFPLLQTFCPVTVRCASVCIASDLLRTLCNSGQIR